MKSEIIFCDFDGTITKEDTVAKLLRTFADEKWLYYEKLWENGQIGSKECLIGEISCIDHISEKELNNFLNNIEIDEGFIDFLNYINKKNIDLHIISDGFDLFINTILKKYNINNLKIFSNGMTLDNGKLKPFYPFVNLNCASQAGMCKCEIIRSVGKPKKIIYIGDGRSDICASKLADLLFAKGKLADYCSKQDMVFIPFRNFNNIIESFVEKEKLNDRSRPTV